MNCYICMMLKLERRIREVNPAQLVLNGVSLCSEHFVLVRPETDIFNAVERARDLLRRWWKDAESKHGTFDYVSQTFANGFTYEQVKNPSEPEVEQ